MIRAVTAPTTNFKETFLAFKEKYGQFPYTALGGEWSQDSLEKAEHAGITLPDPGTVRAHYNPMSKLWLELNGRTSILREVENRKPEPKREIALTRPSENETTSPLVELARFIELKGRPPIAGPNFSWDPEDLLFADQNGIQLANRQTYANPSLGFTRSIREAYEFLGWDVPAQYQEQVAPAEAVTAMQTAPNQDFLLQLLCLARLSTGSYPKAMVSLRDGQTDIRWDTATQEFFEASGMEIPSPWEYGRIYGSIPEAIRAADEVWRRNTQA